MADPTTAHIDGASSVVSVTATRGSSTGSMTLPVLGGSISVEDDPTGAITLDTIELPVGDVVIAPSQALPDGLHLTDVKLSLAQQPGASMTTTWTDDDDATADANLDLLLDWSVVTKSGAIVPLATEKILTVPVTLALTADGASLTVKRPGVFWDWAGELELSDLDATIAASF